MFSMLWFRKDNENCHPTNPEPGKKGLLAGHQLGIQSKIISLKSYYHMEGKSEFIYLSYTFKFGFWRFIHFCWVDEYLD
jgi:hypothetical protein